MTHPSTPQTLRSGGGGGDSDGGGTRPPGRSFVYFILFAVPPNGSDSPKPDIIVNIDLRH